MDLNQSHKLFSDIGKITAAGHSINETVHLVMNKIKVYFRPEHCSLMRVDHEKNELFFAFIHGTAIEKVHAIRLHLGEGIAGKVAANQTSYFISDASKEPGFSRKVDEVTGFVTKSIIAVPLVYQKKTFGVIEIINSLDGTPFSISDHMTLQTIADFAAISLYNAELFEQLRVSALYDSLTGLYNRAMLNKELEKYGALAQAARREDDKRTATVILVDMDNFKTINDSMGHRAGDLVLKDFARKIHAFVRTRDLTFRIGGDEFLIIVYNENPAHAAIARSRLSSHLDQLENYITDPEITYKFSYGIASGSPFELEGLINEADLNMYNNKKRVEQTLP